MQINCILVEDEPLAAARGKQYIQKVPFLNLLAAFDNAMDALVFLRVNNVDLIFLDINLGEFTGIQLLEAVTTASQIILTTAYQEYALKGFDLKVTDYLLKPYTFERFVQAVDRVQTNLARNEPVNAMKMIFIKTENRLEKILLSEIIYIEGMRDYRKIITKDKKIMTVKSFREFEQEILPAVICRVHKSYMVSIDKIDSIEKDIIRIKETLIPISETYKRHFFQIISPGTKPTTN